MNATSHLPPVSGDQNPVFAYPLHWAQNDAVRALADGFDAGRKRQYVDMPTGTGKTAIPLSMMELMRSSGRVPRILIMTKTKSLVGQILDEIDEFTPQMAPLCSRFIVGEKRMKTPVAVSTYVSGIEALESGVLLSRNFDFIVLDEAHCALSELRDTVLQAVECPVIALTATPDFNSRKGLRNAGYHEAFHLSLQKAEETRLICRTRNILLPIEDEEYSLDGVKVVGRSEEYDDDALDPILTRENLAASVAEFYKKWRDPDTGRRLADMVGVAYCNSIKHALLMEAHINHALIEDVPAGVLPARAVWGSMSPNTLKALLAAHKDGTVRHLMSVDYLIEGYNNRKVEAIVNIRPTRSNVVAGQRPGRGSRLNPADPDKVNKVFDLIYPASEGRHQILYADTLSLDFSEKKKTAFDVAPEQETFGQAPQMKLRQRREDVDAFIRERNRRSLRLSGRTSDDVLPAVARAMLDCVPPFTNGADLARAVRIQIGNTPWPDKVKKAAGDYTTVLDAMTGRNCLIADGSDYTLTAYAISSVLGVGLEDLFGETAEQAMQAAAEDNIVDQLTLTRGMTADEDMLYDDPDDVACGHHDDPQMLAIEVRDEKGALTGFQGGLHLDQAVDDDLVNPDVEEIVSARISERHVNEILSSLPPRIEKIIRLKLGMGVDALTAEAMGDMYDISRERIRQLESKGLRSLQSNDNMRELRGCSRVYTRPVLLEHIAYLGEAYDGGLKQAFLVAMIARNFGLVSEIQQAMRNASHYKQRMDDPYHDAGHGYDRAGDTKYSLANELKSIDVQDFLNGKKSLDMLAPFDTAGGVTKFSGMPSDIDSVIKLFRKARDGQPGTMVSAQYSWLRAKLSFKVEGVRCMVMPV